VRRHIVRGLGARIALAALAVAVVAVVIVAGGALVFGAASFVDLMTADGHPAAEAQAMFDASVREAVLVALVVAVVIAAAVAAVLAGRIRRPLEELAVSARRIALGDYGARAPVDGPEEVVDLADSFNTMAASLEDQERMRREFIANAAHELRTPLTNLKGYLEALRDGVIEPDRATFESLWEETERLVRLSRSLDVLAEGDARDEPPELLDLDISAAVRTAVDLFAPAATRHGLELEVELQPDLRARAEPDALAQVLANLLSNAVRYTPPPGVVRVRGERRAGDVVVSVSNTGPGIPAEDLPHVFERFYRVEKARDAASGGAGIGLAIVRQIVESFGGRVGVESANGLTEFWFTLPLSG
jgi:signal transduction histidine kinase